MTFIVSTSLPALQGCHCRVQAPALRFSLPSGRPTAPPAELHAPRPPRSSLDTRAALQHTDTGKRCDSSAEARVAPPSPCLLMIFLICSSRYSRRLIRASDQRSRMQLRSSSWKETQSKLSSICPGWRRVGLGVYRLVRHGGASVCRAALTLAALKLLEHFKIGTSQAGNQLTREFSWETKAVIIIALGLLFSAHTRAHTLLHVHTVVSSHAAPRKIRRASEHNSQVKSL